MGSPDELFKCRICGEQKTICSDEDVSICKDCSDEEDEEMEIE